MRHPGEQKQLDIWGSRQAAYCASDSKSPVWPQYLPTAWFPPFSHIPWFCHICTVLLRCIPPTLLHIFTLSLYVPKCSHSIIISSRYTHADKPSKHNFPRLAMTITRFYRGWIFHSAWELPLMYPGCTFGIWGSDLSTWCDNLQDAVTQTHHSSSTLQQ